MAKPKTLATMAASALVAITVPVSLIFGLEGEELEETYRELNWPGELMPHLTSTESIKDQYKQIGCLTNHYEGTIVWNTSLVSNERFSGIGSFSSESTKSCLLVEYHKQKYGVGKWWGEFKLIWSVKDENRKQGLITVTSVRTQNGQLWGNSAAYTIRKFGSQGDKWFVSYVQEMGESRKTEKTLRKLIPQASSTFSSELNKEKHWGFNPTTHNICGRGDCISPPSQEITDSYYWEFTNGVGNETVYSWTSDITQWLKGIFTWEKLKSKIQNVKGKWEKKVVNPKPKEE